MAEPAMSSQPEVQPRTLHDRLFKEFLQRFLPQFLNLFFPEEAAALNFATLRFVDKELVVNLPSQELRITDLVAEVETWQGEPEVIILHIEVEGRGALWARQTLPQRMSEYYALLRILRRQQVLPIALVLLPNVGGLSWQTYSEELLGHELLRFRYGQVGLRDLSAEGYLQQLEPVAAALATLMRAESESRAAVKLQALRTVAASDLREGDKLFLMELINTYLPTAVLTEAQGESMEQEILDQLLEIEETWGDKLREEGREEGQVIGKRALIVRMLALMFGELPAEAISYVNSITEDATFDQLTQRMLAAQHLEDVIPPDAYDSSAEEKTTPI
jgi:hypothetical protein